MSELTTDINKWIASTKADIISEYYSQNRKASGEYERLLSGQYLQEKNKHIIVFNGAKQGYWMENGRRPNSDQSPEGIRRWAVYFGLTVFKKWVSEKGLNIPPIAIAYKVAREGYSGMPLITKVIDNKRIKDLLVFFKEDYKAKITTVWQGQ